MTSAIFYKQQAVHTTPIRVIHSNVCEFCYGCNRRVCVDVIVTAFLSKPLARCSLCNSIIQYPEHGSKLWFALVEEVPL